jgi:hypothetical protein
VVQAGAKEVVGGGISKHQNLPETDAYWNSNREFWVSVITPKHQHSCGLQRYCRGDYVMDRGYLDFGRLYKLHQVGAFFVTRAKRGMDARRVYSAVTDRDSGVICDQTIAMNGFYVSKSYPEQLRRIRFKDPETGKTLVFLTNNTALPPLTIAALYKNRWQVELFFKWIKQHLRIKRFLGTSENAVKTQIWCAVSTYVLIAIVKRELQLDASLYTLLQILSVSVFEKSQLSSALRPSLEAPETLIGPNQLNLFNF